MKKSYSSVSVSSGKYLLAAMLFIFMGLAMLGWGVYDAIDSYDLDKNGLQVSGIVIKHYTTRGSKGSTNHHAVTNFNFPTGEKVTQNFSLNVQPGSRIDAVALKRRNGEWHIKVASFEELYLFQLIMGIIGFFLSGYGTWMTIQHSLRRKELDHLLKFGKRIKAKVSGVSVKKMKNGSYSIVHALTDEHLKGIRTDFVFDSEPVSGTLSTMGAIGTEVEILVDRQNATSYVFEYGHY